MNQRYSVGELAEVAGVSRRTVRYYVQEGLLPPPTGLGRGAYYGPEHLQRLLRVKAMQEQGMSLEEIWRALSPGGEKATVEHRPAPLKRSLWTRVEILPGVELQVASGRRLPSPGRLFELAEWCRRYIRSESEYREGDDGQGNR